LPISEAAIAVISEYIRSGPGLAWQALSRPSQSRGGSIFAREVDFILFSSFARLDLMESGRGRESDLKGLTGVGVQGLQRPCASFKSSQIKA
jgi:hypothetical protein